MQYAAGAGANGAADVAALDGTAERGYVDARVLARRLRTAWTIACAAPFAIGELIRGQAIEHTIPYRKLHSVGPRCWLADSVSIAHPHHVELGARVSVGPHSRLWASPNARLVVGDDVLIGPNVTLVTANHGTAALDVPMGDQPEVEQDVVIGRGVWIGASAIVLPGCTVGDGAVVAAGAVVIRDVAPFTIVGGVPARPIAERGEKS